VCSIFGLVAQFDRNGKDSKLRHEKRKTAKSANILPLSFARFQLFFFDKSFKVNASYSVKIKSPA
jgi:hypothetical protein